MHRWWPLDVCPSDVQMFSGFKWSPFQCRVKNGKGPQRFLTAEMGVAWPPRRNRKSAQVVPKACRSTVAWGMIWPKTGIGDAGDGSMAICVVPTRCWVGGKLRGTWDHTAWDLQSCKHVMPSCLSAITSTGRPGMAFLKSFADLKLAPLSYLADLHARVRLSHPGNWMLQLSMNKALFWRTQTQVHTVGAVHNTHAARAGHPASGSSASSGRS